MASNSRSVTSTTGMSLVPEDQLEENNVTETETTPHKVPDVVPPMSNKKMVSDINICKVVGEEQLNACVILVRRKITLQKGPKSGRKHQCCRGE